jgi:hypothetical protein
MKATRQADAQADVEGRAQIAASVKKRTLEKMSRGFETEKPFKKEFKKRFVKNIFDEKYSKRICWEVAEGKKGYVWNDDGKQQKDGEEDNLASFLSRYRIQQHSRGP